MPTNPKTADNWADALAHFLRAEPGVEAVRFDVASRKISVATLGEVKAFAKGGSARIQR